MMLYFLSFLFLFPTADHAAITQEDPCRVYGTIYIEKDPLNADLSVYEEEAEALADLTVYEEDNALYADEEGHWCFVTERAFADYYIYFEPDPNLADFSIYYTDYPSFAGCNTSY